MDDFIKFRDTDVRYRQLGNFSKPAVILLHGYLESLEIWDGFAEKLGNDYHVVTMDIPGHGQSGVFASVHTMHDLGEAVIAVADHLGITKFHLVGHSMGGYVTMAVRESFPGRLLSFVLFHSTCYPDNDEKKANRHREIDLVKQGKKDLIIKTSIHKMFANDNQTKFANVIERTEKIARDTADAGIIAVLNGMIERPSTCHLLKDPGTGDNSSDNRNGIPMLLIGGKKDNYIPFLKMEEMMVMGEMTKLVPFENSGHMGFIEEKDKALAELDDFFRRFSA